MNLHAYQPSPVEQCRCACGSLLAKKVEDGIEVKCRRCKRIVLIRYADIENWDKLTTEMKKGGGVELRTA